MSSTPEENNDENADGIAANKGNNIPEEFVHNFKSGVIRKNDQFDLFISYKRDYGIDNGQELAVKLHRDLTADGYKVWLDHEEIGFSSNFEQRIEEAILHSKKFACIIGPGWVASDPCRFEVKKAIEFEKRIIPIHYQEFRGLLAKKKEEGALTDFEWNRIDKPQEIDFSSPEKHQKGYSDLKAVCKLNDEITAQHTKILSESYYWKKYNAPKSMLLVGTILSKAKLVRSKCNSDDELPTFTGFQNEFIEASVDYVSKEVSNKPMVYIAYSENEFEYASELNTELKLQGISTWFENPSNQTKGENTFVQGIINSQNVIDVVTASSDVNDDLKISFARSNNKRVIQVTGSKTVLEARRESGEKNIYFWNSQLVLDNLISVIKGDAVYIASHSRLLQQAFEWEKSDKDNSNLLELEEANKRKEWYRKAEKDGSEPQPNLNMISFVERSVDFGIAKRKKKILAFWMISIGLVFLVGAVVLSIYLKSEVDTAESKIADAEDSVKFAMLTVENLSAIADSAIIKRDEADSLALKAQKDSEIALENLGKAKALVKAEQAKVDKAQQDALEAFVLLDTAKNQMSRAKEDKLEADSLANEAVEKLRIAKIESDSISCITAGRVKALKAAELLQSRNRTAAKLEADSAIAYLTDSVRASAQIQTLYDVLYDLIPSTSVLNQDFNKKELKEAVLIDTIEARNTLKASKYPSKFSDVTAGSSNIITGHGDSNFSLEKINAILSKQANQNHVSALCISPDGKKLAIGFKKGSVEIWNLDEAKFIEKVFQHSYRITTIAFSPDGLELVLASIDEKFTIVKLKATGKKDPLSDFIVKGNGSRIKHMYYWNNNHIITVSWKEYAKIWATDVKTLNAAF